ncbi:hypothetical protein GIB67_001576 [Kingdonia uniflora]|uniref:Uncharacterized protein n=1 Tax=Kingdonia uniflora TaxID=39325 RepID=A0A7J7L0R0_9MAGN|nr:hypothetical protein GIB67_001576 [Kingdonia uniflora]
MIFLLLLSSLMRFEVYIPITKCDLFYHILLRAAISFLGRVKMLNFFYFTTVIFSSRNFFLDYFSIPRVIRSSSSDYILFEYFFLSLSRSDHLYL